MRLYTDFRITDQPHKQLVCMYRYREDASPKNVIIADLFFSKGPWLLRGPFRRSILFKKLIASINSGPEPAFPKLPKFAKAHAVSGKHCEIIW